MQNTPTHKIIIIIFLSLDVMMKVILTYLVACTTQPHVQSLNLNLEPSTELSNQGIDLCKRKALR